jgi:predicted regulator of Ras-like GTPase activity (Roadblock/LC7/MglB family)
MPAMPKREIFERIIQNITSKFPDVYAALFISPEGFPINTWGVTLERAEEISALLSALIGKTWEIVRGVKEGGELQFRSRPTWAGSGVLHKRSSFWSL